MPKDKTRIIEETGQNYNEIIFEEDYIPQRVYLYQIDLRNKIIDKHLLGRKFDYALDLGCGTGFHLKTLSIYSENLIGCDFSFGALKEAKKRINCDYVVCDVNALPFKPNSIEFVWIAGVLHHVPDHLEKLISDISNVSNKGAILMIDEPNGLNPFNHINMKLSKADPTGDERPLKLEKIKNLLEKSGFSIIEYKFYGFFSPFGVVLKDETLLRLLIRLDSVISKTFFRRLSLRWYIIAKKE